jgi:hypothetical protein
MFPKKQGDSGIEQCSGGARIPARFFVCVPAEKQREPLSSSLRRSVY